MRLFYALWPADETRSALVALQQQIGLRGRPTPAPNLHLTMAFLGQQPVSLLPSLKTILTRLQTPEFSMTLDRIGYFSRQGIAWAGMTEVPEPLLTLQAALAAELAQQDISYAGSLQFQPHVTLARGTPVPAEIECEPIIWNANTLALVASSNTQEGAIYQVLALHRLDGSF